MFDVIRLFFVQLSREDKFIASCCGLWGWFYSLILLDINTFTWEFVIKGCAGLSMSAVTVIVGLVIKDFYAIKLKPKIFKNGKTKNKDETENKAA